MAELVLRPSPWSNRSCPVFTRPQTRAQAKRLRDPSDGRSIVPLQASSWKQKSLVRWTVREVISWCREDPELGEEVAHLLDKAQLDGPGLVSMAKTNSVGSELKLPRQIVKLISKKIEHLQQGQEAKPLPQGTIFDQLVRQSAIETSDAAAPTTQPLSSDSTAVEGVRSTKRRKTSAATVAKQKSPIAAPPVPITITPQAASLSIEARTLPKTANSWPELKVLEEVRFDQEACSLMLGEELECMAEATYLDRHHCLDVSMRSVLVDWLMEVCREFELQRESFYMCISLLDRFLSHVKQVHQSRLQLVGVAALLLAAKTEEIYPPKAQDLALITDGAFNTTELRKMESCMLQKLTWNIYCITPFRWITLYLKQLTAEHLIGGSVQATMCEMMALLDLAILDYATISFRPSHLASAALVFVIDPPHHLLKQVTGLEYSEIKPCVAWLDKFYKLVKRIFPSSSSASWCCQPSSLYRNVVHPKDVHLVQPYFPQAIEQLEENMWRPARETQVDDPAKSD